MQISLYNNIIISLYGTLSVVLWRWIKRWSGGNCKYRKWLLFNYISNENSIPFLVICNSLKWLRNITSAHLSAEIASCSVNSHCCGRESGMLQFFKIPFSGDTFQPIKKKKTTLGTSQVWEHLKIIVKANKAEAAERWPCTIMGFSD